jgi:hypothetical protein
MAATTNSLSKGPRYANSLYGMGDPKDGMDVDSFQFRRTQQMVWMLISFFLTTTKK